MSIRLSLLVSALSVLVGCSDDVDETSNSVSEDTNSEDTNSEDTNSEDTNSEDTNSEDTGFEPGAVAPVIDIAFASMYMYYDGSYEWGFEAFASDANDDLAMVECYVWDFEAGDYVEVFTLNPGYYVPDEPTYYWKFVPVGDSYLDVDGVYEFDFIATDVAGRTDFQAVNLQYVVVE